MSGDPKQSHNVEGDRSHVEKDVPDLVGEELGDDASIWRIHDRIAREEDRERIGNWNRGLDNLALFAGLFSAVTTAFIIELQGDTKPDYMELTFQVLNASASGVPFVQQPFVIDPDTRTVNCLWISSLMLSLTAALIAIMGKDWIGMYASRPLCNPRQWAEIRTYRLSCVERWYMSGVIAAAPVLLHMSLVLFAAGLVLFVAPDSVSQRLALGLSLAAGALYGATVLSAVVFSSSPFKSPATESVRGSVGALFAYLRDRLVYRARTDSIRFLQHASLVLATVFAYPTPTDLLSPQRAPGRRSALRMQMITFPARLSTTGDLRVRNSWRNSLTAIASRVRKLTATSALSATVFLRSMREYYLFWRQRPRTMPWHYSLRTYVRRTYLLNHWSDVRSHPEPELLASSLSLLSTMSPSPQTFHSILVSLGDVAIGNDVAPLVSPDLRNRLTAEIRHNWHKADLETLSRYILVDRNLSRVPLIYSYHVEEHFGKATDDPSLRSEAALFASVRIYSDSCMSPTTLLSQVPTVTSQPRGMKYLLPLLQRTLSYSADPIIILASRYWHHLKHDRSAVSELERELRRQLLKSGAEKRYIDHIQNRFSGRSGLLELLAFNFDDMEWDARPAACDLIMDLLDPSFDGDMHSCLAYIFGGEQAFDVAWKGRRWRRTSLAGLGAALPLLQYRYFKWDHSNKPPIANRHPAFEACLARTVVGMLSPEQHQLYIDLDFVHEGDFSSLSFREASLRCLHTLLCHSRSNLEDADRSQIIRQLLENSALCSLSFAWLVRFHSRLEIRTERGFINILTAIARHLVRLLRGTGGYDRNDARLFCLFLYSETRNALGDDIVWDLGEYLYMASARLSEQEPSTAVSMRRLLAAITTLRPFREMSNYSRTAWDRMDFPTELDDTIWDDDYDLALFFNLCGATTPETVVQEDIGIWDERRLVAAAGSTLEQALFCLDASMR
ncbi:hypothetical protein AURDEDRAFT_159275 [Auricularia subglabra TFB-10046 SS5]|nr:hypothetical protein AURDEDRAFT_159275 [Auricularia subglabra TFB-10046 SS5]